MTANCVVDFRFFFLSVIVPSQASAVLSQFIHSILYSATALRQAFGFPNYMFYQPISTQKLLAEPIGLKLKQSAHLPQSKHIPIESVQTPDCKLESKSDAPGCSTSWVKTRLS